MVNLSACRAALRVDRHRGPRPACSGAPRRLPPSQPRSRPRSGPRRSHSCRPSRACRSPRRFEGGGVMPAPRLEADAQGPHAEEARPPPHAAKVWDSNLHALLLAAVRACRRDPHLPSRSEKNDERWFVSGRICCREIRTESPLARVRGTLPASGAQHEHARAPSQYSTTSSCSWRDSSTYRRCWKPMAHRPLSSAPRARSPAMVPWHDSRKRRN
jgi:hypothetical protein